MTENIKYKVLMFIRYLGDSFFYPFFALYLSARGLIESEIGFILSISPLLGIICNPIFSHICKNIKTTKNVLTIISIVEAVMIFLISLSSSFTLITVLTILMAIFGACHYGLMDSLTVVYANQNNINFSSFRIFGSSAYIIGSVFGGYVIKAVGYQASFAICAILFILSGITYFLIKPINIDKTTNEKGKLKEVLTNKSYILYVLIYVFIVGTCFAGDNFLSVYLETRGIESNQYGMIFAYIVFVEVIFLFILNKISKKVNTEILLVIAALLLVFRFMINGLYASLPIVIICAGLRGITYSIMIHISFEKVLNIVGPKNSTLGVMFMTLCYSIFLFVFNNLDGSIIESAGNYTPFYTLMVCLSAIGVILTFIQYIIKKDKNVIK